VLIEAVKELKQKNDSLKTELDELKELVKNLSDKINS
jgi:cell division protein FtsB